MAVDRRPKRSEIGPMTRARTAVIARYPPMANVAVPYGTANASANAGNEGKNMFSDSVLAAVIRIKVISRGLRGVVMPKVQKKTPPRSLEGAGQRANSSTVSVRCACGCLRRRVSCPALPNIRTEANNSHPNVNPRSGRRQFSQRRSTLLRSGQTSAAGLRLKSARPECLPRSQSLPSKW